MRGFFLTIATVLLFSTVSFSSTGGLDTFTARADGDGISIEWRSLSESGLKNYAIERSDVRVNDFQEIGSVNATGSYSYYKYRDSRINAAPLAGQSNAVHATADMFKYRLRMNFGSEVSYSTTIAVTRPSSGVRRTWGMIKEMFH